MLIFGNLNIFRFTGDCLHLIAIFVLLFKILKKRSSAGISGKTQILYVTVYITRYLDLFTEFFSLYNSVLKIVFISVTSTIVFLIFYLFRDTYDHKNDSFRIEYLIVPAGILALMFNFAIEFMEILWAFSIYLEAVAILPQMNLIRKTGKIGSIMAYYLILMGSYRGCYCLKWIYRYYVQNEYDLISTFGGVTQTIIYICFFIYLRTTFVDVSKAKNQLFSEEKEKRPLESVHIDEFKKIRMEKAAQRLITENGLDNGPTPYEDVLKMVFSDVDIDEPLSDAGAKTQE